MGRPLSFLSLLFIICMVVVACSPSEVETPMGDMPMQEVPEALDTSTTKETEQGLYTVSVTSDLDPLTLNQIHSWTIYVESKGGQPIENAEIEVGGGMPQHNHGFPTSPEVTEELGGGEYRLEGMKFSMGGWWELKLQISVEEEVDEVTFNIVLPS